MALKHRPPIVGRTAEVSEVSLGPVLMVLINTRRRNKKIA